MIQTGAVTWLSPEMLERAFFSEKFLQDSLEQKCSNFHYFRLNCHILRETEVTGDEVELLAVERGTSHWFFHDCHQHTLPMLVKRVVEGGYMVFLELCCFGGAKKAGRQFSRATSATSITVVDCAMVEIAQSRCLPGLLHLPHRS